MEKELDRLAMRAAADPAALTELADRCEGFLLRVASNLTGRYITKSDDEWSVALGALAKAAARYSPEKGGFYAFAELVVRNGLIDYLRTASRHTPEISLSPFDFDQAPDEESAQPALQAEVLARTANHSGTSLREEIEAVSLALHKYGFGFLELADCSPHAQKTKDACAKVVCAILDSPILLAELKESGLLPIKILSDSCSLPRKILERHRKYILAAVEILSGEYPGLAEYLRYIGKERGR